MRTSQGRTSDAQGCVDERPLASVEKTRLESLQFEGLGASRGSVLSSWNYFWTPWELCRTR